MLYYYEVNKITTGKMKVEDKLRTALMEKNLLRDTERILLNTFVETTSTATAVYTLPLLYSAYMYRGSAPTRRKLALTHDQLAGAITHNFCLPQKSTRVFKRHRSIDLAASKNGVLLSHCLTHNNWFGAQKPVLQYRQGWNSV